MSLARQTKVPIRGQVDAIGIQTQPPILRFREVAFPRGHLEDRRALIDLVKFGAEYHPDVVIGRIFVGLIPHEVSTPSRYGIDRWSGCSVFFEVVPTEPRPHGGHVSYPLLLTMYNIFCDIARIICAKSSLVFPSSDVPRMDSIQRIVNALPCRPCPGIADSIAPPRWDASY